MSEIALPNEQTAAVEQQQNHTIGALIATLKPELARALPKGMDSDRLARLALTVVRQTPRLAQSTPQSFAGAMLTAAALGLEVGVGGEAYLVPYTDKRASAREKRDIVECQLIVGYQGYCKLFWQSPMAKHIDAQAVYENDDFDYAKGTEPFLRHRPAKGDRGDLVAYYAVAALNGGGSTFDVFTPNEIKKLRNGKVGTSGDIADPMRWMERKTALKQVLKMMPRSTQLNQALAADEALGSSLRAEQVNQATVEHLALGSGEGVTADEIGAGS